MYQRFPNGWLERTDFIILDMIFLQIAFVFSYFVRNGFENPYENEIYLSMGMLICLIDVCTAFFLESYRDIMLRGYFREFTAVLKHVTVVCGLENLYLFLSKQGGDFSRISYTVFFISAIVLLYAERVLWKTYLRWHKKMLPGKKVLLLVTTGDIAEHVVKIIKENQYNEIELGGIVLLDRSDMKGKDILGERVVCRKDEMLDYIQTRWVDAVLLNVNTKEALPDDLINTLITMGVTVHQKIAELGRISQNQRLQAVGGYGRNQCRDGIDCLVVLPDHKDPDDIRTADNRGVLDQIRIAFQLLVQDLLGHVEEDVRDLVPNVKSTGVPIPVAQCIPANLDFTNHMVVGERVDGFGVGVVRSSHS